jgi:hypothetical protein
LVQVEIEKTNRLTADKATFISCDPEIDTKTFDRKKLEGLVICKNNVFRWYDDKHQYLSFVAIDVKSCDFTIIDNNTKLELLEHIPQEMQI